MTRDETYAMLRILQAAYPTFYRGMKKPQAEDVINLWSAMFAEDDAEIVKCALYKLIETHSGFPPDIADVKDQVRMLIQVSTGEPTDEELWRILRKAVTNGYYGAKEEFDKMPKVLQRYLGSPSAIRDMAVQDEKTLDTVVKGQFLKQIPNIRQRQEYHDSLPPAVRDAVSRLVGRMPDADAPLTLESENRRRNEIADALDERG